MNKYFFMFLEDTYIFGCLFQYAVDFECSFF